MSDLVDRLVSLTVTVASPDGNIRGKVNSERFATFRFQDEELFYDYSPQSLAKQTSALIRGLASGRQLGIEAAYRAEGREYIVDDKLEWDAAWRRFHEAAAKIEPVGVSSTGLVALASNANLSDCVADVDDEFFDDVGPDEFIRELGDAYRNLLADWNRQRYELRLEHTRRLRRRVSIERGMSSSRAKRFVQGAREWASHRIRCCAFTWRSYIPSWPSARPRAGASASLRSGSCKANRAVLTPPADAPSRQAFSKASHRSPCNER